MSNATRRKRRARRRLDEHTWAYRSYRRQGRGFLPVFLLVCAMHSRGRWKAEQDFYSGEWRIVHLACIKTYLTGLIRRPVA